MPEEKDYSTGGTDRGEWDLAWRAMPHRRHLPGRADIDSNVMDRLGNPASITVSQDPSHFADRLWRQSEICPICGNPAAAADDRMPASIHPKWTFGLSIGIGVWVHRTCFESCPVTDEAPPIPW